MQRFIAIFLNVTLHTVPSSRSWVVLKTVCVEIFVSTVIYATVCLDPKCGLTEIKYIMTCAVTNCTLNDILYCALSDEVHADHHTTVLIRVMLSVTQ